MTIGVGSRVKAAVDLFTDDGVNFEIAKGTPGEVISHGITRDWRVLFDGELTYDPVDTDEIEEVEA